MAVSTNRKVVDAKRLVDAYLLRTGISGFGGERHQRYLWTDAHAVAVCFSLSDELQDSSYKSHAIDLIDTVHHTLGRHRPDDGEGRTGWISGLPEEEAVQHPTLGGLRIGKPLPERRAGEAADEALEWLQDGQYFHYLTCWVRALLSAWRETEERDYAIWAAELMEAAGAFLVDTGDGPRIRWKMSIDLTRPLVASMGAHDPLEGLLCVNALRKDIPARNQKLAPLQEAFQTLCRGKSWVTTDPLGAGGLLLDLCSLCLRTRRGEAAPSPIDPDKLLLDVMQSVALFQKTHDRRAGTEHRLAFRECGLSLGIRIVKASCEDGLLRGISSETLAEQFALAEEIENYWSDSKHQEASSWTDHEHINAVMLASSLASARRPWPFLGHAAKTREFLKV